MALESLRAYLRVVRNHSGRLDLSRANGVFDTYSVSCTFAGADGLVAMQTGKHSFAIKRPARTAAEVAADDQQGETVTVEVIPGPQVFLAVHLLAAHLTASSRANHCSLDNVDLSDSGSMETSGVSR